MFAGVFVLVFNRSSLTVCAIVAAQLKANEKHEAAGIKQWPALCGALLITSHASHVIRFFLNFFCDEINTMIKALSLYFLNRDVEFR